MAQAITTTQETSIVDVFNRHLEAFATGNLDSILADFDEDCVILTQTGVFTGLQGVRAVFSALLDEFGKVNRGDSPGFSIDVLHAHGDTLYITWHATSKKNVFPFGTDTFVIVDGKIVRQSISFAPPRPR